VITIEATIDVCARCHRKDVPFVGSGLAIEGLICGACREAVPSAGTASEGAVRDGEYLR
jgi:recombinational DNA repair protein (RecF pathway)